jgi:hypothetical protein
MGGYSGLFFPSHRSSSQKEGLALHTLARCRAQLGLSQSMARDSKARHWSCWS